MTDEVETEEATEQRLGAAPTWHDFTPVSESTTTVTVPLEYPGQAPFYVSINDVEYTIVRGVETTVTESIAALIATIYPEE